MDIETPQNPQHEPNMQPEQAPEPDRKTILKAVVTGGVLVTVIGFVISLLQGYFAADDPSKFYRTMADARAQIVDYAQPQQASNKSFMLFVPQDDRTSKRYEVSLKDFEGKPVLLAFWASWCQPCHREMPILDGLYDELTAMGLHVVPMMTSDKSGLDGARYFYRGADIQRLPLFLDHGTTLMREFQVRTLPQLFFISAEGETLAFSGKLDIGQAPAQDLLRYFAQTGQLPQ